MILLMFLLLEVNAYDNPHGPKVVNDFTGCINNLMEINFDKPGLLIFGYTRSATTPVENIRGRVLKNIHETLNFSVEIKSPTDEMEVCSENPENDYIVLHRDRYASITIADYFVIIVDTYTDFIQLASQNIRTRIWNPHAKFIIALLNLSFSKRENVEYVEKILTCLFRYNVINVIVVVPDTGNIRNALIYSWKPYDPPKYCGYYNETAQNRLILENTCEHGVATEEKLVFYNKVPNNMMKCVLNILAVQKHPFVSSEQNNANIEIFFINTVVEIFNFTTNYKLLNQFRGERNENGEWNGALNKLVAKDGHVLLGGIYPNNDVHEDFDSSFSYFDDSYTWVLPITDPSPPWKALTVIFKTSVWYSLVAGLFLCVTSWIVLGFMSNDSKYHKSIAHCFLNTCIVSLGFSAYVRPMKHSLRVFFVFLNFYCIILVTAYQTKLIKILQHPTSENQVDTIEELVSSGLKFGGSEELRDLFANSNDTLDTIINDKWIDVEDVSSALIDVAVHRNFSVLCSRLQLAHLTAKMPELNECHGNSRYYAFELDTFKVPVEMIALKGFPFMKEFSKLLRYFKQLGMNNRVKRYYHSFNSEKRTKILLALNVETCKLKPLTYLHLQGGFDILLLGMLSGSVVFIIEIIVNCKYIKDYFKKINLSNT